MFTSRGIVKYDTKKGYRATVEIDQQLADYYFSLIPKYHRVIRPRYAAHITLVRPEIEIPTNLEYWEKYQNESVEFLYSNEITNDKGFYWIFAWSKRLEKIRNELGLFVGHRIIPPPPGFDKNFHCSIAKNKDLDFYD